MARWKLLTPHYLMLKDPSFWEQSENDRTTGRMAKKRFIVPTLLDPNDKDLWNYFEGQGYGEIHVSDGNNANARDYIITGNPSPDMIPLDDEARAISAKFEKKWEFKAGGEQSYGDKLLEGYQKDIAEAATRPAAPIEIPGMSDLLAAMATMCQQNAQLIASLHKPPEAVRRV